MKSWTRILRCIACVLACMMLFGTIAFADGPETEGEELQYVDVSSNVIKLGGLYKTAEPRYVSGRQRMLSPQDEMAFAIKNIIETALRNQETSISVTIYNLNAETLNNYYTQVLNENPELIYATGYSYGPSESLITTVYPKYSKVYTKEKADELVAKAQEIVGGMSASFTDEQKILYLHDYLVTHCQYDLATLDLYDEYTPKQIVQLELGKFNAYNALVEGSAVCQGYSEAMVLLGKYAGLDIKIVTSEAENHAWNMINLDNVYYFFDCTWDDPTGDLYPMYCGHSNLLRSRDGMVETGHDAGTDWTCGDLGNVYDYCTTSKKYESYFWSTATSAIPMIGDTYAYAKAFKEGENDFNEYEFKKVYLRKTDGTEQEVELPEKAYWYVWNGNGSIWKTNFASFTSYGNDFYFSTYNKIYKLTTTGDLEKVHELSSSDVGYIYGIMASNTGIDYWVGIKNSQCEFVKGEKAIELTDSSLAITDVNVVLQNNLALQFFASKSLYAQKGYNAPFIVFNVNGKEKTVQATDDGTNYVFICNNIAPQMIGDRIGFTVYAMKNGAKVKGMSAAYSVKDYCDYVLQYMSSDTKLMTLVVDLLNYGAATQTYASYKTDALANKDLTTTQQGWATDEREYVNVATLTNADAADLAGVSITNMSLVLNETVAIRYFFTADSISGLTLEIKDDKEQTWTFSESDFVLESDNNYHVDFRKLQAKRMSDVVYATFHKGSQKSVTAVYSIESYASIIPQYTTDQKLLNLISCMMKYGDAAKAYAN